METGQAADTRCAVGVRHGSQSYSIVRGGEFLPNNRSIPMTNLNTNVQRIAGWLGNLFFGSGAPQDIVDVTFLHWIANARASSASCWLRPGRNPYEKPRKSAS